MGDVDAKISRYVRGVIKARQTYGRNKFSIILLLCKSFTRWWWVLTVNETRGSLATNLQIKYLSKIFEIYCTLEWCIVMATHLNIKTESNICLKYLSDIRHIRLEWCIVTITLLDQLLATIVTNALRWLTEKPLVPMVEQVKKTYFAQSKKKGIGQ